MISNSAGAPHRTEGEPDLRSAAWSVWPLSIGRASLSYAWIDGRTGLSTLAGATCCIRRRLADIRLSERRNSPAPGTRVSRAGISMSLFADSGRTREVGMDRESELVSVLRTDLCRSPTNLSSEPCACERRSQVLPAAIPTDGWNRAPPGTDSVPQDDFSLSLCPPSPQHDEDEHREPCDRLWTRSWTRERICRSPIGRRSSYDSADRKTLTCGPGFGASTG